MTVTLRALGPFRNYMGDERQRIDLPEGATLRELLSVIDRKWGDELPPQLWDRKQKRPESSAVLFIDGKTEKTLDCPLREGQEVMLVKIVVGG